MRRAPKPTLADPLEVPRDGRLGIEIGVLAALLVGLAPWLCWHVLQRTLLAIGLTLATPADTPAATLEGALAGLRAAAPFTVVEPAPGDAVAVLWAGVHGQDAPPPLLVDVRLWPALGLDAAALEGRVREALPDAVVAAAPTPLPAPWSTLPLALLWAALAGLLAWHVRRGVRRALAAQRDALMLLVAFGGRPERIDRLLAAPLRRRATLSAGLGSAAGAAAGLAGLVVTQPLAPGALLAHPWWSLPASAGAIALILTLTVRLLARRQLAHRLQLALA
jgi:hypothetical protein